MYSGEGSIWGEPRVGIQEEWRLGFERTDAELASGKRVGVEPEVAAVVLRKHVVLTIPRQPHLVAHEEVVCKV